MMFFNKEKPLGTIFLNEDKTTEIFIDKMGKLAKMATGPLKREIETQIRFAKYGKHGEDNIAYELRNSGLDMYVLQDLYFQHNGLSSQIDYMVFTRNKTYIIESKNLIGNIEINKDGDFIRTYNFNNKETTEGMYSPITQNQRHKQIIKNMMEEGRNFIQMKLLQMLFDSSYKTIVVLANSKTILNDEQAPKEMQNQIIRADGLIRYIKEMEAKDDVNKNNEQMLEIAQFFLNKNIKERKDYSLKYEELVNEQLSNNNVNNDKEIDNKENFNNKTKICPKCKSELILRSAKKGINAGNQFYGCSGYPKCRYIENI